MTSAAVPTGETTAVLSKDEAKLLNVGDSVLCWPGERKGVGYLMFLAYEGVHDIGGTPCIYVRPMGGHSRGMALSHCAAREPNDA